jgi:hypothetical protein
MQIGSEMDICLPMELCSILGKRSEIKHLQNSDVVGSKLWV